MLGLVEVQLNEHTLYSHDFYTDPFIKTCFRFHTPIVELFQFQRDSWGDWYRELGFRAPTTLVWHKEDFFWSFNVSVLGFGISVAHQNGY